jgi:hypothetical protein
MICPPVNTQASPSPTVWASRIGTPKLSVTSLSAYGVNDTMRFSGAIWTPSASTWGVPDWLRPHPVPFHR